MTATLEGARPSRTHWLITMYAGGGEFCDGYILSIIGVALPLITASFKLSSATAGLIGSASLLGMFVGGLVFGRVTDKLGRQKVYLADIAAFIVLSVLQMFATEPWQLVALRLAMGIAIGADFAIAGTIASEFAPQRSRGPLLVVMVTMWSVGAATAYIAGWAMVGAGPGAWRWMLASSAIPAVLILLLRIGTPESPRWLLSRGRTAEARAVVEQMLGPGADLSDIDSDDASVGRYADMFRAPYLRRTVFISVFWACQLLPIYAIATYEPTILQSFGMAKGNASYLGAVVLQIFYVVGSLSGALFVNRGRRQLLLWSFAISAVPLLALAWLAHPPVAMVIALFVVFGLGSFASQCLQAIYPSELFPTGVRATANGFATGVSRVGAAIGTYGAPILLAYSTRLAMLAGAAVVAVGWVVSYLLAPETSGLTLTEASSAGGLPAGTRQSVDATGGALSRESS
jgi:MFS transporter, putative metabolite transport protein